MKKTLSIILTVMMIVCMIPVTVLSVSAEDEENVTYIDRYWDADAGRVVEETRMAMATPIDSSTSSLDGGWYFVDGKVDTTNYITAAGTADNPTRIILKDGASLTTNKGLIIKPENVLFIYGQALDTGTITATATASTRPGIGGDFADTCGTITINGGTINAKGGANGAGIGGSKGAYGTITINGGTVTAQGGKNGAGIGNGQKGAGGTITINGGTVTATGGQYGAGIGGGQSGEAGTITVNGGTVTATGGKYGASIGGGSAAAGGTVTITGGTVTATGGQYGAGIGGGSAAAGGTVTITGGTVTATGLDGGVGIGAGAGSTSHGDLNVGCDLVKAGSAAPGENIAFEKYLVERSAYIYIHMHLFDCCEAADEYLKTPATYTRGGIYYMSCECGACDTSENAETFEAVETLTLSECFLLGAVEYGLQIGRQGKLNEEGWISIEEGRTIIPLTPEQLAVVGDKLTIAFADGSGIGSANEYTVTTDCVYTYFYDVTDGVETKYEAGVDDLADFAAFIIIDNNGAGGPVTGYGYFRVYNGDTADEDNFMFDALYKVSIIIE